jgi:kynurenine formamidase
MTAETVQRAARLIRTGQTFELGRELSAAAPTVGSRRFELLTQRTVMNTGTNRRGSNEEILYTELGHVGTQFDGFAHQTIGDSLYNCHQLDEISSRTGFTKLGVQQVGTLMTRGVLIDVAALKGVAVLPDRYEITVDDLRQALTRQNVALQAGDAVLIHTGWGTLWGTDNARFVAGCPGIGTAAAEWLAGQSPMLVGSDNWPVEVAPNPDPNLSLPVHQILLVVNGIHLLENLRLDELAAARAYEFALVVQPLKIAGGTGSTVAPAAFR